MEECPDLTVNSNPNPHPMLMDEDEKFELYQECQEKHKATIQALKEFMGTMK